MDVELNKLIERARNASARFDMARRPIVVEFAGCPKAGKTSTISQVAAFFKRTGFKVQVVIERASVCPIRDKTHSNFNVWTSCTTLANLLEKTQDPPRPDDPQILILDRGIFDSICWFGMMERLQRLRDADRRMIESFLLIDDWRKRLSGVVLMLASPEDSLEREGGHLPVPGFRASIMNSEVLAQMRIINEQTAVRHEDNFRILSVDTSAEPFRGSPKKTCYHIAERILTWTEEHIAEEVLHVPRAEVERRFGASSTLAADSAEELATFFHHAGQYKPRDIVEADGNSVQAIPVAIIRTQSGQILRLKRKERDAKNSLNEKIVVWAGGHVRAEDDSNGETLRHATVRELHEELRLDIDKDSLVLLGAVYVGNNARTAKHVAIVYEWRAPSDDVSVSLSAAEFFERRGTSVSGTFVDLKQLQEGVSSKEITEPWTTEIIEKLLPEAMKRQSSLF